MRKIETEMIDAIRSFMYPSKWHKELEWSKDNTTVQSHLGTIKVFLHGNCIARLAVNAQGTLKRLQLSNCGYLTPTTKSRLNAILGMWGHPDIQLHHIYQKNYLWYINKELFPVNEMYTVFMAPFYTSIDEIKDANKRLGHHFFTPNALKFFKSRIGETIYHGKYFITSEKRNDALRLYTIREAKENGSVKTVGDFQQYRTSAAAITAVKKLK